MRIVSYVTVLSNAAISRLISEILAARSILHR